MRGLVVIGLLGTVAGTLVSAAALAADTPAAKAGLQGLRSPQGPRGLQGTSWSSIARLPDWSGVWELDWRGGSGRGATSPPKLTPEYAAREEAYRDAQKRGENQQTDTANCVPPGMPQIMTQPYPVEFLFTPGKVTVVIEAYSQMRRIFIDGRPHLDDPDEPQRLDPAHAQAWRQDRNGGPPAQGRPQRWVLRDGHASGRQDTAKSPQSAHLRDTLSKFPDPEFC
jgi:hypothetical protein